MRRENAAEPYGTWREYFRDSFIWSLLIVLGMAAGGLLAAPFEDYSLGRVVYTLCLCVCAVPAWLFARAKGVFPFDWPDYAAFCFILLALTAIREFVELPSSGLWGFVPFMVLLLAYSVLRGTLFPDSSNCGSGEGDNKTNPADG